MAKQPSGNIRINVFLPEKTLNGLKVLAARRGTSYSELVRNACYTYLIDEITKEKIAQEKTRTRQLEIAGQNHYE